MTISRRANWRAVKLHRNYTVDEAARLLGVCKATVRRWIKAGLPVLRDQKPLLILGDDLAAYHKARVARRKKCQSQECYCVKCRAPREIAGGMAEYVPITTTSGNLRALCNVCGTLMHRRIALEQLANLEEILENAIPQAQSHLMDTPNPSLNGHLEKETEPHA